MRLPRAYLAALLRGRYYLIPALLLVALWLPGADQGWYRTDTHYYAAIAKVAFERAAAAPSLQESARALLFLRAGDEPYLNKPPLPFWIHGLVIHLVGAHLWTVRLPSLLAAIVAAIASSFAIANLGSRRMAMVSGFVLATTLDFSRYTRAFSLDLWMLAFMMIAVAFIAAAIRRNRPSLIIWSGIPIGLALLCKPLVALICPALLGVWLASTGRARLVPHIFSSVLLALAVAAPWHVAAALEYPGLFLRRYFVQESLDRAVDAAREPVWYYARILAQSYWPWIVTLFAGLIAMARYGLGSAPKQRRLLVLSLIWSVGWLLVITVFGGKASRYIVPVFPFLSVFSAWFILRTPSRSGRRLGRIFFVYAAPAALLALIAVAFFPLSIHPARDACWDRLEQELAARPGVPLLCTQKANALAANLVMQGRPWPALYDCHGQAEARSSPRLLMIHPSEQSPDPAWPVIAVTEGYTLVQIPGQ